MEERNLTDRLPDEILENIILSVGNIKPLRLVNSRFSRISSPFLINRVFFSARHGVLKEFREIANHLSFSKNITEITFDGSFYEKYLANDLRSYFGAYVNRVTGSQYERDDHLSPPLLRLHDRLIEHSHPQRGMLLLEISRVNGDPDPFKQWSVDGNLSVNRGHLKDLLDRDAGPLVLQGFQQYCQLSREQEAIVQTGDEAEYLRAGLSSMPNVTKVSFEDCTSKTDGWQRYWSQQPTLRGFGLALGPTHWAEHSTMDLSGFIGIYTLFSAISLTQKRIRTIHFKSDNSRGPSLPYQVFRMKPVDRKNACNSFLHATEVVIQLELNHPGCHMEEVTWCLPEILSSANNLHHLELTFGDYPHGRNTLEHFLGTTYWPHLSVVKFKHIKATQSELEAFFERHRQLLRHVSMKRSWLVGGGSWYQLIQSMRQHLRLERMEFESNVSTTDLLVRGKDPAIEWFILHGGVNPTNF